MVQFTPDLKIRMNLIPKKYWPLQVLIGCAEYCGGTFVEESEMIRLILPPFRVPRRSTACDEIEKVWSAIKKF
jgi:hypothetical protein